MEAHSPTPLLLSGETPKENLPSDGVGHPLGYHLNDASVQFCAMQGINFKLRHGKQPQYNPNKLIAQGYVALQLDANGLEKLCICEHL